MVAKNLRWPLVSEEVRIKTGEIVMGSASLVRYLGL